MKFKIPPKVADFFVESTALVATLLILAVFGVIAWFAFVYPFPTYRYFTATVEYENELPMSAENGGIVVDVLAKSDDSVTIDQPVIRLGDRENKTQYGVIAYDIKTAQATLEKARTLQELGAVSPLVIREQELALQRLKYQQSQIQTKSVRAPYSGRIYFTLPPEKLVGRFLLSGETVGYLYTSTRKVIKITTMPDEFRRFRIGTTVKLFSKEMDIRKPQMTGTLYEKSVNRQENMLQLYGEITTAYDEFATYAPGSQIQVGILITDRSLFESFFDFNVYAMVSKKWKPKTFGKIEKFLTWLQH